MQETSDRFLTSSPSSHGFWTGLNVLVLFPSQDPPPKQVASCVSNFSWLPGGKKRFFFSLVSSLMFWKVFSRGGLLLSDLAIAAVWSNARSCPVLQGQPLWDFQLHLFVPPQCMPAASSIPHKVRRASHTGGTVTRSSSFACKVCFLFRWQIAQSEACPFLCSTDF